MVSAGLDAVLERFSDPTLLGQGKVNLISLEAIQQRLGNRWQLRQDQVYAFAERVLERGVGTNGLVERVSPTDFLVAHLGMSRLAGQAACLRYLREILNHFLGDAHQADTGVLQITRIAPGALSAQTVDVKAAEMEAERGATEETAGPANSEEDPADCWSPFVAGDGRKLRVSAKLEPVYELRGYTRIGFRMVQRVLVVRTDAELSREEIRQLSSADLLSVDVATVRRGIDRLKAESGGEQQLSLIVPVSYTTLASQRGRAEIVRHLREAASLVRCGVICQISEIEGVPSSALLAAVTLVKPFAVLVVGQLQHPVGPASAEIARGGLQAVSLSCPASLTDPEFAHWAKTAIAGAKKISKSVIVYGVDGTSRVAVVAALGATHFGLRGA